MKILDKKTGEYKELRIKPGGDTLPIGTIVEYDGKIVDIFDKNNINNLYGYIYGTSNIYVSSTTGADKMLYVPIESSKTYVVSKVSSTKFRIATNPTVPTVGESTVTSKVANDKATELSITSGSTDKYLILYYYNSSNDTLTEQEILNSIKIKKQDYTIPEGYEEVEDITEDLTSEITLIDGITYNECVMKRCGDVINLALAITFATEQTADEVTIAKIPAKYVKNIKRDVFIGSNRTLLYGYIGTSGDVIVTKPNSTWVGTNMTWII